MNDEQLEAQLEQLLRDAGVREDVFRRAYARSQLRLLRKLEEKTPGQTPLSTKRTPSVAGFPFSILEHIIRAGISLIEYAVEWLVDSMMGRPKR